MTCGSLPVRVRGRLCLGQVALSRQPAGDGLATGIEVRLGQSVRVAPDPALAFFRLQQLRLPVHLCQQGDRDVVQAALAPGLQVVGDGDDARLADDEAGLFRHLPDGCRLEGLPNSR